MQLHGSLVTLGLSFFAPVLVASLAAFGCSHVASTSPQDVDIEPITTLQLPALTTVVDLFPGYEIVVSDGIHVRNGAKNPSGVLEWVTRDYSGRSENGTTWNIRVDVLLHATPEQASRGLKNRCAVLNGLEGELLGQHDSVDDGTEYCVTDTVRLREDSEGLRLPSDAYLSVVAVRKRTLLIHLHERRLGDGESNKSEIIPSLADALKPQAP